MTGERRMIIDENGIYHSTIPMHPEPLICEYKDCREPGKEYHRRYKWFRKVLGDKWWNEPLHLCNKHSKGHKPI